MGSDPAESLRSSAPAGVPPSHLPRRVAPLSIVRPGRVSPLGRSPLTAGREVPSPSMPTCQHSLVVARRRRRGAGKTVEAGRRLVVRYRRDGAGCRLASPGDHGMAAWCDDGRGSRQATRAQPRTAGPPSAMKPNCGRWPTTCAARWDAAEYKHVVLGLIFLKYISDAFEERRVALLARWGEDAAEDRDEYISQNVFWVPAEARWSHLRAQARQPTVGLTVDQAMAAIERDNPALKAVLPRDYARPVLDKRRLGQLIDLVSNIQVGDEDARSRDVLGRVYEYFLSQFASAEGQEGRRVLHPALRRQGAGRDAGAVPGPGLRPVLRLVGDVRAVGRVHPRSRQRQRERRQDQGGHQHPLRPARSATQRDWYGRSVRGVTPRPRSRPGSSAARRARWSARPPRWRASRPRRRAGRPATPPARSRAARAPGSSARRAWAAARPDRRSPRARRCRAGACASPRAAPPCRPTAGPTPAAPG